eukprot:TRINITY_DN971_c0_g1_i1.p1 TRINITY_DN971_c0_g1~~TRINITY_DN971_c0_g1_i1.p1  ORF type:complete len:405 (-),score=117.60 TRINITY_DN971_c0_g1_i1:49-1263(-)
MSGIQYSIDDTASPASGHRVDSNAVLSDSMMMTPAVLKLYKLRDAPMVEDDAKNVFDSYARSGDLSFLTLFEVRAFLSDLQQAFGYPPFIPDESLSRALRELQLDYDTPEKVSWTDFKSFFVYLVHSPLRHLHNLVIEPINASECDFKKAVWVSNLPPRLPAEDVDAALKGVFLPNSVVKTFVSPSKDGTQSVSVVFFNSLDAYEAAIKASGCTVFGRSVVIEMYREQIFPAFLASRSTNPSVLAYALAHTVEFGEVVGVKSKELDEQLKITESLKKFDDTYKVSEKTAEGWKVVSEKSKQVWTEFDEKTHVSETVSELAKQASETQVVQTGWSFLRGIVSNVSSTIAVLRNETIQVLEEKKLQADPAIKSGEENIGNSDHAVHQNDDESLLPGEEDVVQYGSM